MPSQKRRLQTPAMSDAVCGGLLAAGFKDGLKLVEVTPQVAIRVHAVHQLGQWQAKR
jgi:hypothetical protein